MVVGRIRVLKCELGAGGIQLGSLQQSDVGANHRCWNSVWLVQGSRIVKASIICCYYSDDAYSEAVVGVL
jgi:hypothetical protein